MTYRAEIDGLRTIAVVAVLIYHMKIPFGDTYLFAGGFLGVDIFFVISGYLITSILCAELDRTGAIDLRNFYFRRFKRLYPPLLTVLLVSTLAGFAILTPTELDRYAASVIATIFFVSNFFWFSELGDYGAQAGLLQPLLHTWSLAIEEQFYLVFPLFLGFLMPGKRPRLALWTITLLIVSGLLVSEITTRYISSTFSFFSPVSRAWELLFGSALAFVKLYRPSVGQGMPDWCRHLPKISLALLLAYIVYYDLGAWTHPGFSTLPVILATSAIIFFARPGEATTTLLSTGPFVWVGKLSYSLYLWHFPVFAYGRLSMPDHPSVGHFAAWSLLSLALAAATYYLVERPFRFSIDPKKVMLALCSASLACVIIALAVRPLDLLEPRDQLGRKQMYGEVDFDNERLAMRSWSILDAIAGDERIDSRFYNRPSRSEQDGLWFGKEDTLKILVLGNSHAKDLFNALHLASGEMPRAEYARYGMGPEFTPAQMQGLAASANYKASDAVLIAPRYFGENGDNLRKAVLRIKRDRKIVAIVGNTPEFESPGRLPIFDYAVMTQRSNKGLAAINSSSFARRDAGVIAKNDALKVIARETGVIYLSRDALVCAGAQGQCFLTDVSGAKHMYDATHWTLEGARFFGERARQINWLYPVFREACDEGKSKACGL